MRRLRPSQRARHGDGLGASLGGVLFGKFVAHLDLGVALVFVGGGLDAAQGVVDGAQGVVVWLARGGGDGREVPLVVARLELGGLRVQRLPSRRQHLPPRRDRAAV